MAQIINITEVPTRHEPWHYTEKDGIWTFHSHSPAGEYLAIKGRLDWFASDVWGGLARYLMDIYECFDPDTHVENWFDADSDNEERYQDLLSDAEAIGEMYYDLAKYVNDLAYGKR